MNTQLILNAPQSGQLTTWASVRDFLFAGNARFTLRSLKTGVRFTYRVRVRKADVTAGLTDPTYFIETLRGPDNDRDYLYLGVLRQPGTLFLTPASRQGRASASFKAIVWALDAMRGGRDVLGKTLEIWHEGRCGRCGRVLTVPESIASGYGPECAGLHSTPAAHSTGVQQ